MNQPATSRLRVFVDLDGVAAYAGVAYLSERRHVLSTSFDYDHAYQSLRTAYAISPDLPLTTTKHHVSGLPGAFADSAPDRWGRNLINKRVQAIARATRQAQPTTAETDYLLGVSDATRQGSLRYTSHPDGPFLATETGVPQLIELPRLLAAADEVLADPRDDRAEGDLAAVKLLLDAGSGSLGGARPKASVRDGSELLIAKFPHRSDEWDLMAWEKTTLDLAERAGIPVPQRRLLEVGGRHVLLLERFDRHRGTRVGYISAMTLLGASDGIRYDYTEVAEAISEHGSAVRDDLAQLWRRIAFSVVVNNTDDHLRNHGFLRDSSGWRLSPAFDINPEPDPARARVTSIGYTDDPGDALDALLDVCGEFALTRDQALATFAEVVSATRGWREVATSNGVRESECARFADVLDRFA